MFYSNHERSIYRFFNIDFNTREELPIHCIMSSVADETYRLLLLGKTGAGKSKTGNIILGGRIFPHGINFKSVTANCKVERRLRNRIMIEVMDAPGLFDTGKNHEEIAKIIVQAVAGTHPGPNAILYVIRLGRYTEEDLAVYQRLKALFDETLSKYMIILFTGGDELEADDTNIADVIEHAPPPLKAVLRDCNYRYVVFNNMLKGEDADPQVNDLLAMVSDLKVQNNNVPYVCIKYGEIGEEIEREVARRLGEVEKQEVERKKQFQELKRQKELAEEAVTQERAMSEAKEKERIEKMKEAEKRNEEEIKLMKLQMEKEHLSAQEKIKKEQIMREQMEKARKEEMKRIEKDREKEKKALEEKEKERKDFERKYNEEKQKQEERDKARDEEYWELKKQAEKRDYGLLTILARGIIPFYAVVQDAMNM